MRVDRAGQHVIYTLGGHDVIAILDRRAQEPQAHHGPVEVGQPFPAFIVYDSGLSVNLRVLLDGRDEHWATGVFEGRGPGTWREPNPRPIVED